MRIVWVGGPGQGLPEPLTCPVQGQEYDVADHVAMSLIEQGKATFAPPPKAERPKAETVFTRRRPQDEVE